MSYDIYLRAICTEKDTSDWIFAGTYTTLPSLISEFPYYNDFNDEYENANWKQRTSKGYNWYMGVDTAGLVADKKNMTDNAFYFSCDGGLSPINDDKYAVAHAYRYIELKEGTYNFSFDWVVPGNLYMSTSSVSYYATVRVLLMPVSTTFDPSSILKFNTPDGVTYNMSSSSANLKDYPLPKGFFDLSKEVEFSPFIKCYGMQGTDVTLPLEEQWQHHSKNLTITAEDAGAYMLMFSWWSMDPIPDVEGYRSAVIDNLSIVKAECATVTDVKVDEVETNTATLSWSTTDNTVASYDVLILNADVDPNTATDAQKAYIIILNKLNSLT
jgi:hypothetical protein